VGKLRSHALRRKKHIQYMKEPETGDFNCGVPLRPSQKSPIIFSFYAYIVFQIKNKYEQDGVFKLYFFFPFQTGARR
jgi:hypothetical protein